MCFPILSSLLYFHILGETAYALWHRHLYIYADECISHLFHNVSSIPHASVANRQVPAEQTEGLAFTVTAQSVHMNDVHIVNVELLNIQK